MDRILKTVENGYGEAKKAIEKHCVIRFPNKKEMLGRAMGYFDEIVQTVVLISAMADGEVHENEITVIKSLAVFGNIEERLNSQARHQFRDWTDKTLEDIARDIEKKEEIERLLKNSLIMHAQELRKMFTAADKCIPDISFIDEIKKGVKTIVDAVTLADGDIPGSEDAKIEIDAGLKAFYEIIEKDWKACSGIMI